MAKVGARKVGVKKEVTIVTCSSGISVRTRPISVKLLELFERSHIEPEPPVREAMTIGGVVEMVADPDDPEYQELKSSFNKKATDDFLALILDLGVDLKLPDDNAWERSLKRAGLIIPDDLDDKRLFYIQTIVMPDFVNDLQLIAASVLRQSGVTEEAIDSWVALF